ncbi:MAG: hypothetical protein ABFD92_19880 [Planctomycetaceae bacterium]|nr:hypothetical protein [Planctomycetaceae bacterium]
MKAKRRHELQHNVLGTELSKLGAFLKKYGTYVAWAVLIVALIALIINYSMGRKRTAQRDVLAQYQAATQNPELTFEQRVEKLQGLAQQETNPFVAAQATVTLGDDFAGRLITLPPTTPPDERRKIHTQAESYYRQALDSFSDNVLIVGRARLGLARLAQTTGDFPTARKELQAIVDDPRLTGTPAVAVAKDDLKQLDALAKPVAMQVQLPTTAPAATSAAATAPATAPARATLP